MGCHCLSKQSEPLTAYTETFPEGCLWIWRLLLTVPETPAETADEENPSPQSTILLWAVYVKKLTEKFVSVWAIPGKYFP